MRIPKYTCHKLSCWQNRFCHSLVTKNLCVSIFWTVLWFQEYNGVDRFHRRLWSSGKSPSDCKKHTVQFLLRWEHRRHPPCRVFSHFQFFSQNSVHNVIRYTQYVCFLAYSYSTVIQHHTVISRAVSILDVQFEVLHFY